MKYSLLQKYVTFVALLFLTFSAYAQNNFKLPKNTVFYMEVNGKLLNKKVNWAKFNPVFNEVLKKENKTAIWNDYSKTGVKYDDTQFHYYEYNDSVRSYNAHFILDDEKRFVSFINSVKKEGLEVTKKAKYSYVSLDENTFIAWNDKRAVLKNIYYSKPYKYDDVDILVDSTAVAVDSAYVDIVPPNMDLPEDVEEIEEGEKYEEKAFDYKEEIQYLEEDLVYLKETVKTSQIEIEKVKKDIAYLKKHHKYPDVKIDETKESEEPVSPPLIDHPNDDEDDDLFDDEAYLKRMDSIKVEDFKIVKALTEKSFDEIFSSNFNIEVPKDKTQFRDAKADLFAYTNFGSIFTDSYFGPIGLGSYGLMRGYLGKLYDSDSSYNLYFDDDKVKLITNYRHNDPKVQKTISEFYSGTTNKKLANLLSDKSIGYFSVNLNGYKSFDATYDLIESLAENQEYKKEISLMVETMKIVLDEKAISKIIPGNAIFILNDLKYKKVEYTDYEYDEDYNEKEVTKTKDAPTPDFTFAFATDNEGYWNRLFDMMSTNKETSENFKKKGNFYEFKDKYKKEFDRLIFAVKDGIVYLTTSAENIGAKPQSSATRKFAKEVSKHSMSGWFNAKKLVVGLEKEFEDQKDKDLYHLFRNKTGELTYKSDANSESIQTETNYHIDGSSENSLMYFFDLFDDIYKIVEPADKYKKL